MPLSQVFGSLDWNTALKTPREGLYFMLYPC